MRIWVAILVSLVVSAVGCRTAVPTKPLPTVAAPEAPDETRDAETPAPGPTPTPAPAPRAPNPGVVPSDDLQEPLIRVLLRRSSRTIELPEPGRAWRVSADGVTRWMWGPLQLEVESQAAWYQIGAFSDEAGANEAKNRLSSALGEAVELRTERTDTGFERVQIRWKGQNSPADPLAALAAAGFDAAFVVKNDEAQLAITGREGRVVTAGEALLEPAGQFPLAVDGRRYRGRLRARAIGGEILLINVLNLERYLLGVVPLEMGPSVFPELAALKAQSVAARTYAVAHLGDHDDEGYDICDTPACQVYGGAGAEHSLSTRAIEETTGVIAVYDGVPIDAMYTSTCGGHSEASSELFSGRAQPYLQPVVCSWERPLELRGSGVDGPWVDRAGFSASVLRSMLGLIGEPTMAQVLQSVAAEVSNAPSQNPAPPTDLDSFAASLLEICGLERSAAVLTPEPPGMAALLFLTDLYGVSLDPPSSGNHGDWVLAAAFAALEVRGDVVRDSGEAVPRADGVGIFPRRAKSGETLPDIVPVWEQWREGFRTRAGTELAPGTLLERYRSGEKVFALVVRRSGGNGEADRRSAWREWVREKKWSDLALRLGIPDLEKIEITKRTASGRVVGLAAVGRSGDRKEWKGFDVRRALDLPETYFTVHIIKAANGERVARFLGRGWGHGVGLCQNGSYGLARAGRSYEEILGHYYTGISLVRWRE